MPKLKPPSEVEPWLAELEDALRMEADAEDLQSSEEGIALKNWLRRCRRILRRIRRLARRMEDA